MKRRIDLEKAGEAEAFGALAVGAGRKHHSAEGVGHAFTPAQGRALFDLVRSLVQVAREAGAKEKRVIVGGVSLELRDNGSEEILSIQTSTAS